VVEVKVYGCLRRCFLMSSLRVGALLCCVLVVPTLGYAQAQASIAGSVRDTSGAVLPGVTVEASSPELIEKVRSAITDATGQYRIENLRPGTYTVTFALAGFSTVRREGIELAGTATFNVNAELKVGTLEETITVTGESPIVDVQTARRSRSSPETSSHRSRPLADIRRSCRSRLASSAARRTSRPDPAPAPSVLTAHFSPAAPTRKGERCWTAC
jgi:hypothetical protein